MLRQVVQSEVHVLGENGRAGPRRVGVRCWGCTGHEIGAADQRRRGRGEGRRTYDIFRRAWPSAPDETGRVFNRVPKYVVSRGRPELSWAGTTHLTDVAAEGPALRSKHEHIHVLGSADLIQTLLREGLVDQLNLWIYPIVLGQGQRLFPSGTAPSGFHLREPPISFPAGAVLLRYRRVDGRPDISDMTTNRGAEELPRQREQRRLRWARAPSIALGCDDAWDSATCIPGVRSTLLSGHRARSAAEELRQARRSR